MPPCVRGAIGHGTINHRGTRVAFTFAMTRNLTISKRWRVFRPWPEALALAMLAATPGGTTARAAAVSEPAGCRTVRLADVGWTDVTATTAVLSALLRDLGYDAHTTLLSVPVTFASMKRGNIDVFLGGHPVAEKHVDIAALHRRECHRHRQQGGVCVVAEITHQGAEDRGGRRSFRPT